MQYVSPLVPDPPAEAWVQQPLHLAPATEASWLAAAVAAAVVPDLPTFALQLLQELEQQQTLPCLLLLT